MALVNQPVRTTPWVRGGRIDHSRPFFRSTGGGYTIPPVYRGVGYTRLGSSPCRGAHCVGGVLAPPCIRGGWVHPQRGVNLQVPIKKSSRPSTKIVRLSTIVCPLQRAVRPPKTISWPRRGLPSHGGEAKAGLQARCGELVQFGRVRRRGCFFFPRRAPWRAKRAARPKLSLQGEGVSAEARRYRKAAVRRV